MHIWLVVENNSGKTLDVDCAYSSLSVNGLMVDFCCWGGRIEDGKKALLNINMYSSSLEKIQVSSISDIKELEFVFEIEEEGWETLDSSTISLALE